MLFYRSIHEFYKKQGPFEPQDNTYFYTGGPSGKRGSENVYSGNNQTENLSIEINKLETLLKTQGKVQEAFKQLHKVLDLSFLTDEATIESLNYQSKILGKFKSKNIPEKDISMAEEKISFYRTCLKWKKVLEVYTSLTKILTAPPTDANIPNLLNTGEKIIKLSYDLPSADKVRVLINSEVAMKYQNDVLKKEELAKNSFVKMVVSNFGIKYLEKLNLNEILEVNKKLLGG
ncbi:MAG: hypothetical protein KKA19_03615 [Candidatus Margulisbacteria bacterium]|nr:hypothetical protein [Candidatus Margulisiibacteriota bacterium]